MHFSRYRSVSKRIAIFSIAVAACVPAFALGGFESLTGDDRKLAELVKTKLQVSDAVAFDLYKEDLAGLFDTKEWQFDNFDNDSLSSTKVSKSQTRQLHFSAVTDNRFFTVTFVKFMPEGQVQIFTTEMLPRQSNVVTEKYENLKKDPDFELSSDKATFSVFRKKRMTSRTKLLSSGVVGGLMYTSIESYDLPK